MSAVGVRLSALTALPIEVTAKEVRAPLRRELASLKEDSSGEMRPAYSALRHLLDDLVAGYLDETPDLTGASGDGFIDDEGGERGERREEARRPVTGPVPGPAGQGAGEALRPEDRRATVPRGRADRRPARDLRRPGRSQTTVVEYARRWASGRPHNARTAERTESMIRSHIEGTSLGGRRLAGLLPSEVQAWVTDRSRVLAPSSLRAVVKLLRSILNAAVLDRLIASSPAVRLSLPSAPRERIVPLTVEQVSALADAIGPPYRGDGGRAGVPRAAHRRGPRAASAGRRLPPPGRARRALGRATDARARRPEDEDLAAHDPLPRIAAAALAEHLARFPASAPVRCACSVAKHTTSPTSGLIFHTRTGGPHAHEHYGTRVFGRGVARRAERARETCERCDADGWVLDRGRRAASAQCCHHTAEVPGTTTTHDPRPASPLRLGHDDATLTLPTYGHLMPSSDDQTRKAIDEAWTASASEDLAQNVDQERTEGAG